MSALRDRVLRLRDSVASRPTDPTIGLVPAGDLMQLDEFRFLGGWFRILRVRHFAASVEVQAADSNGPLSVDFLPHEAIEVRLPRPQAGKR